MEVPFIAYPCRRPEDVPPPSSPEQRQAQLLQSQLSPHELAYQESLIHEREAEIREIETGIHELAEIFRDLGTLVNQQGSMIGEDFIRWSCLSLVDLIGFFDNIELNISSVAADTGSAAEESTTAAEYQRKAGRRAACMMLIVVFVVAIVLLAVSSYLSYRNSFTHCIKDSILIPILYGPLMACFYPYISFENTRALVLVPKVN